MMSLTVGYDRATFCMNAMNSAGASGEDVSAWAFLVWKEKATRTPRSVATGRSAWI